MRKTGHAELGAAVLRARKRRGWTLQDVADMMGTSKAAVGEIERGARWVSANGLERLTETLGIRVSFSVKRV